METLEKLAKTQREQELNKSLAKIADELERIRRIMEEMNIKQRRQG